MKLFYFLMCAFALSFSNFNYAEEETSVKNTIPKDATWLFVLNADTGSLKKDGQKLYTLTLSGMSDRMTALETTTLLLLNSSTLMTMPCL